MTVRTDDRGGDFDDNFNEGQRIPLFEKFNSLAHKRKTINIGHPAVIWHRAYWKPDGELEFDWHRNIDFYLHETAYLFQRIAKDFVCGYEVEGGINEIPEGVFGNSDRADQYYNEDYTPDLSASVFRLEYADGTKVAVVIEKFDEFWSSKAIIDFSSAIAVGGSGGWSGTLHAALVDAEDLLVSRYNRASRSHLIEKDKDRNSTDIQMSEITLSISQSLYGLENTYFPEISDEKYHCAINAEDLLFVNFVGMSLGIDAPSASSVVTRRKATRFGPREALSVIDNIMPDRSFKGADVARTSALIQAAWPLVKGVNPYVEYTNDGVARMPENVISKDNDVKREFTISLLNRGRSLYVTSLGAVRYRGDSHIAFPLSYLIISPHKATWQIGRIVDRVHSLGLFRLAALQDYETIERANDRLSELGNAINRGDDLGKISRDFSGLLRWTKTGLVDRIEWSRYYLKLFNETMGRLSFERVEGYQTYEEFISRRLSGRFLTIEDVSGRIDGLSRQIRARTAEATGASIEELLGFAEIVSVVPIPYYLSHVMDTANSELLALIKPHSIPFPWQVIWLLLSIGYGLFIFVWRQRFRDVIRHFGRRRTPRALPPH
jgi:hypothetical protein